jgi:hypothetical protein
MVGEKWRLREQTWKRAYEGSSFLRREYRNRCRAILPCDPKFFYPRVNALRTAKVRARPDVCCRAESLGLFSHRDYPVGRRCRVALFVSALH